MPVILVGLNHRTAPLALRETVAFSTDATREALRKFLDFPSILETVLLFTCNRTEIYAFVRNAGEETAAWEYLREYLVKYSEHPELKDHLYQHADEDAVAHLFRVAGGLDSMVIGEPQILGQVKDAYVLACEENTAGAVFHRLFHKAFRIGKKIRTETCIGEGPVSVSYAAVKMVSEMFEDVSQRSVLLIGAGKTGSLAAQHLVRKGIKQLFIANRTPARAEELARELNGSMVPMTAITELLPRVDLVITAVACEEYVISAAAMAESLACRNGGELHVLDLAVPRSCDPRIDDLDGVCVHEMDTLQRRVEETWCIRHQEMCKAETEIGSAVREFFRWLENLQVVPTLQALQGHFDEIRRAELNRYRRNFDSRSWRQLDLFTRSLIKALLHIPVQRIKEFGGDDSIALERMAVVRSLFDLEDADD